jgi:hypothetical protein
MCLVTSHIYPPKPPAQGTYPLQPFAHTSGRYLIQSPIARNLLSLGVGDREIDRNVGGRIELEGGGGLIASADKIFNCDTKTFQLLYYRKFIMYSSCKISAYLASFDL